MNTIRLAHYQHDQFFYDLCDEKGMVVWAEISYISRHMPDGRENTITQMKELIKQLFTRKYLWATHVWNMYDFGADARTEGGENGQNHKGLMTIDRSNKKDAFYAYKAWLSDDPFVHLCGKRYIDRVEDVTKVTVYSNLPEVELFVNGESIGKKTAEDHFFYFDVKNVGESTIVDIMQPLAGKLWFLKFFMLLAKKQSGPKEKPADKGGKKKAATKTQVDKGALDLMKGLTVLRMTSMMGMRNISFTKEELLELNSQLNKIKRPRK